MNDLVILGTDTDAGKTTFALLWMSAFADAYEYWKPVETGPSDTEMIRTLVPEATVHPPRQRFDAPVAPPLAARMEGTRVDTAPQIVNARPWPSRPDRRLLIETFGGPFSPLYEWMLQLDLIRRLGSPRVLVVSSAVGAIGRTLQCLAALEAEYLSPRVVVLVGRPDEYAALEIDRHTDLDVFSLQPPSSYDQDAVRRCAEDQHQTLVTVELALGFSPPSMTRRDAITPISQELISSDQSAVWHPYTPLGERDAPLPCLGAKDEFLHLHDGRKVIDAISSWWTILHGHRHPLLM